ncbi:MAG: MucR family transcriptional regulator [Candidatus Nanopelagicales bacterium]
MFAPLGRLLTTDDGERVVCHACGAQLRWISADHLRRHGLTAASYRARYRLSARGLMSPVMAQARLVEGRRRYESNAAIADGLQRGRRRLR